MDTIGYEDCDYISMEADYTWWMDRFPNGTFRGMIPMELHVPCRDPIDHLLSQCNHFRLKKPKGQRELNCNSSLSENEFHKSIDSCLLVNHLKRFNMKLKDHFPVKCFDFQQQFTTYTNEYLSERLQPRRLVSTPYIKRDTNSRRNKTNECIWRNNDLLSKAKAYLIDNYEYYQFCDSCLGTPDDISSY